jgi:hypothetical protein
MLSPYAQELKRHLELLEQISEERQRDGVLVVFPYRHGFDVRWYRLVG